MKIQEVEHISGYRLKVTFINEEVRLIDLKDFFSSRNYFIQKYAAMDQFLTYRIDNGVLSWGDNELDINPNNILRGDYNIKYKQDA